MLSAAGFFKYEWPFSWHKILNGKKESPPEIFRKLWGLRIFNLSSSSLNRFSTKRKKISSYLFKFNKGNTRTIINQFKGSNENPRTTLIELFSKIVDEFWLLFLQNSFDVVLMSLLFWADFKCYSGVFINTFEQVNTGWVV